MLKLDGLSSLSKLCDTNFRGQKFHIMTKKIFGTFFVYFLKCQIFLNKRRFFQHLGEEFNFGGKLIFLSKMVLIGFKNLLPFNPKMFLRYLIIMLHSKMEKNNCVIIIIPPKLKHMIVTNN
jgi:hypothetical protein